MTRYTKNFVIILNYNGASTLRACVESALRQTLPCEVTVVDNCSTDGSLEEIKRAFPRLYYIRNSTNLGYSTGNNGAIRFALERCADGVLLLNNDATLAADAVEHLTHAAEESPKGGVFTPIISTKSTKRLWFSGGTIAWMRMRAVHQRMTPHETIPYETGYSSGCAMFVTKEVFQSVGLLDEGYFLYYEDADFSMRARRAGFPIIVVPHARADHEEQSTTRPQQKLYWLVISGLRFFDQHAPFFLRPWIVFYKIARRMKNSFDCRFCPSDRAAIVSKAYHDYANRHATD